MLSALKNRDLASRWPTAPHFVSWLNLCPDNDISGGRVLWRGTRKGQNRAGQIFRMAAYSLHRSPTPLGNYLRRMKAKLGPKAATTATAHKPTDLRAVFGFHAVPFTREIATDDHLRLPFLDEAFAGDIIGAHKSGVQIWIGEKTGPEGLVVPLREARQPIAGAALCSACLSGNITNSKAIANGPESGVDAQ